MLSNYLLPSDELDDTKNSLRQLNTLETNLEMNHKEFKLLNEKVEQNNMESVEQMKIQSQDMENKHEEVEKLFLREISEKEKLLKSFFKTEVETVLGKIDNNCAKLNTQISNIHNDITNIKYSANATDNEYHELRSN